MKTNPKLIWAIVAGLLLVLLGLGWWLRGSADPAPSVDASASEGADAPALEPRRTAKLGSRDDVAGQAKAAVGGTVRTRGGGPIAGAQVCAFIRPSRLRGLDAGLPVCTTSGSDGRYRLEGLWPTKTTIEASAASHQPDRWRNPDKHGTDTLTLRPGETREGIDVELLAGGLAVAGVVKDISGGEIEGALVTVGDRWSNGARAVVRTDEQGRFTLWTKPGTVTLQARAEGYAEGVAWALSPTNQAELFLTPESVLVGRVVHAQTGEPLADVTMWAGAVRFGESAGDTVRSDADGNFRIGGLQPGAYKPTARADNFYGEAATQVQLGLGQTSEPIEIRAHPTALVEGRIVMGGDEPCTDGSVRLRHLASKEQVRGETDEQGTVLLRSVLPGEYEVTVSCRDMVPEDEYPKLVVGEENLVDQVWKVHEGQAMRGFVVDDQGRGIAGISVSARMQVDPNNARAQVTSSWSGESEDDGSFELTGLLPGTYDVSSWGDRPGARDPVTVELPPGADRNDVRIELPATGNIRGRVVDERGEGQANVQVVAGSLGQWKESQTRTDDDGNFLLEHVRTGEVRVMASADRWGDGMRRPGTSDDDEQGEVVELTADATIEVQLLVESRTGFIRGTVVDETGAPVDDAFVAAERISEKSGVSSARSRSTLRWAWNSEPKLSEADGSFTLDGLAPGTYVVRANRKGGGEAILEDVALGSNVELTIEATGGLSGIVRVEGGPPPERFTISANDNAAGLYFSDTFFRTNGVWELRQLPPGNYTITANASAGDGEVEATLAEGQSVDQLEITLRARVTIKGRLVDAVSGAPVPGMTVQINARGGRTTFGFRAGKAGDEVSDEQGNFTVEDAATGKVNVTIMPRNFSNNSNYSWTSLARTLPSEPSVQDLGDITLIAKRLEPNQTPGDLGYELAENPPGTEPEQRRLTIAFVRPGGPAEVAGLVVGDEIQAVDGHQVGGERASDYGILVAAPEGTVLTLGLADGRTVKLTLGKPRR